MISLSCTFEHPNRNSMGRSQNRRQNKNWKGCGRLGRLEFTVKILECFFLKWCERCIVNVLLLTISHCKIVSIGREQAS